MKKKTSSKKRTVQISQSQELASLRKIVDLTSSGLDLGAVLSEVVKIVNEITQADSVFIYLANEKAKSLILMASKISHFKELGTVTLKIGEGITGWVAREGTEVHIKEGAYRDKRFKGFDILPEDKYEAFLSVPIVYKKKVTGVINIQHKRPYQHAPQTVNLLSTIAKQVGGLIENARLYTEARKKAVQFDKLVQVSQSVTSESYLDEILNLIVVVTAEMINSKICSIMLLDEKGKELAMKATQSLSEEYKRKPNIKVDQSLSGQVVKSRKPLVVYDVRLEERYAYRDLAIKEGLSSMISVPMIVKDKVIGIINVYTQEPYEFSQEEVNVLQMVANQAAIAVENTKLMEETLKAKEALETRKVIERAKGILMRMQNLSEEAAHKLIHKKSMDSCKTMKDVAESIILMDDLQKK